MKSVQLVRWSRFNRDIFVGRYVICSTFQSPSEPTLSDQAHQPAQAKIMLATDERPVNCVFCVGHRCAADVQLADEMAEESTDERGCGLIE